MITVKMWKEFAGFEPLRDGKIDIDGTVRLIAAVKDKTPEEVEEETPIEELLPVYLECVKKCNEIVFLKINQMPKNADGDSH